MITETIHNEKFITLEKEFLLWLEILGYSPSTVVTRRRNIREFLLYLERCGVDSVEKITSYKAGRFVRYLGRRENRTYGSGLKTTSINIGISTVNKFFEYLRQTGTETFIPDNLMHLEINYTVRGVLTAGEVKALYDATYYQNPLASSRAQSLQMAISQRDRAMLGIYYGCGLRKSEGVALDISDVLIQRSLVHVRKGKGCKERYVPVTEVSMNHFTEYLQDGRTLLASASSFSTESFFLNQYGQRCGDQGLSARLRCLVRHSGNTRLQKKSPSLHSLRHSIATHLLQSGMQIEMIQQFLGHQSLASTQIYTHLVNEL